MNLTRAVRHVADNARAFGPSAAFHDLAYRGVNHLTSFQVLRGMTAVVADLNPDLVLPEGFESRFASKASLLDAAVDDYEMSREFVESALTKGDDCLAIYDQGRLASFGWYSSHPTRISEGLVLHFDPSWVYMYKGFTHPDYRGKRLHGIGMALAAQAYTKRGFRGLISYVASNNLQSLRSVERMGYRTFGDIFVAGAPGNSRIWATPGCRRYQFRLESLGAA